MPAIISPNMNLPVPSVGTTFGPDYAYDVNQALTLIDTHDHTVGNGVPITPLGMNINTNLNFNNNPATNLQALVLVAQSGFLDNQSVYVKGVDLYYRDGNGAEIQITIGGSVNGTPGSITGLSGTAGVNYNSGVFTFSEATNTPGDIKVGSIFIGNNSIGTNFVEISAPPALSGNYPITLFTALPGSQSIVTIDNSGNLATPGVFPITNTSIAAATILGSNIAAATIAGSNIIQNTITGGATGNIGLLTITSDNIANGAITPDKISNNYLTDTVSASGVPAPDLTATMSSTFTTTGRPVRITVVSGTCNLNPLDSNLDIVISVFRNSTLVGVIGQTRGGGTSDPLTIAFGTYINFSLVGSGSYQAGPKTILDYPSAGTYTYKIVLNRGGGNLTFTANISSIKLTVQEI